MESFRRIFEDVGAGVSQMKNEYDELLINSQCALLYVRNTYFHFECFINNLADRLEVQLPERAPCPSGCDLSVEQDETWRWDLIKAMDLLITEVNENHRAELMQEKELSRELAVKLRKNVKRSKKMNRELQDLRTKNVNNKRFYDDNINYLIRDNQELDKKLNEQIDYIEDLKEEVRVALNQHNDHIANERRLQRQIQELETKLVEENESFETKIQYLNEQLDEMEQQVKGLLFDTKVDKEQVEKIPVEIQSEEEKDDLQDRQVEEVGQELDEKMDDLQDGQVKDDEEKDDVEDGLQKQHSLIEQNDQGIPIHLEGEPHTFEKEYVDLETEVISISEQVEHFDHRKRLMANAKQNFDNENYKLKRLLKGTTIQLQKCNEETFILKTNKKVAEMKIDNLKRQMINFAQKICDLETDLTNISERVNDFARQKRFLADAKEENAKLKRFLRGTTNELQESKEEQALLRYAKQLGEDQITELNRLCLETAFAEKIGALEAMVCEVTNLVNDFTRGVAPSGDEVAKK